MRNRVVIKAAILVLVLLLAGCSSHQPTSSSSETADWQSSPKIKTIDDLHDKRIGVLLGGVHDEYANKTYPDAEVLQYKSQSDLILAVKSKKIDAGFFTHESLLDFSDPYYELGTSILP